jgi:hypothetical protein
MRSGNCIFIVGVPAWRRLGEYVTLDRAFYSLLFKQEVVAAQLLPNFFLIASLEEAFTRNI